MIDLLPQGSNVLAIIPARGGSKGLPNKNILNVSGAPLVTYPIKVARRLSWVNTVICSTDSAEIAEIAREAGATVPGLRPSYLATDETSTSEVLLYTLDLFDRSGQKFDFLLVLEPTSPLTEADDVCEAFSTLLRQYAHGYRAVISVKELREVEPDSLLQVNKENDSLRFRSKEFWQTPRRRQDYARWYVPDGSLYISHVETFQHRRTFVHERTVAYVSPEDKVLEIDSTLDLDMASFLLSLRGRQQAWK